MTRRSVFQLALSAFGVAAVLASHSALGQAIAPTTRNGLTDDPCVALPAQPAEVSAFIKDSALARAQGRPLPIATAEGTALYMEWRNKVLLADFGDLCRYRAENKTLSTPTSGRIVFMGDSITEAWREARPDFFSGDRIDRGVSGQTTTQMLVRFYSDVIALRPSVVHILAGTNDIAQNAGPTSLQAVEHNIESMVELAQRHHIRVVIGTVLPAARYSWRPDIDPIPSIAALNTWIRSYAKQQRIGLVDYFAALNDGHSGLSPADSGDGVHPTSSGYAKMEITLADQLGPYRREARARLRVPRQRHRGMQVPVSSSRAR